MAKSIGLAIPDRSRPSKGAFDIRPRKVEDWVQNLPKANLGETARQVFHTLVETNKLKFSAADRTRFLEELRPTTQFVTEAMRKHFIGVAFPLPVKSRKVAAAAREINSEMAIGYKIALEDYLASRFLFTDKKLLAKLIHRAMTCLSRVLLTSYQVYAPYPRNIWSEIHKLYTYAETHKLLKTEISDRHHVFIKKSSIAAEYSRILLLYLASPYRLRQGEAAKVFDTLERWTPQCHLYRIKQDQAVHGYFAVNIQSDEPPRNIALVNANCTVDACRTLDCELLADTIRDEIVNNKDIAETTITGIEMSRPQISHDLMRRLLTAWGIIAKRGFPRTEKYERVLVSIGLNASHQIITDSGRRRNPNARSRNTDQSSVSGTYSKKAIYDSAEVADLNTRQPDVWNLVYPTKISSFKTLDEEKVATVAKGNREDVTYHAESWAILNESANGYCIQNKEGTGATVQVGEIISVRRVGDGHSWKWGIGVIRWMKYDDESGLTLGVEMLTPDAAAVGVRASAEGLDNNTYQRTLMLPELPAINQPSTLITAPVPFRIGHHVTLKVLGKEMSIKFSNLIQNTGLFAQFEYEIIEKPKLPKDDINKWPDDKDFGNVWSEI